jgi:hypothetical protein
MKNIVRKILKESSTEKIIDILLKKNLDKWNYIEIYKLLESFGYSHFEIKDIYIKYLMGNKKDDVELVEELINSKYGLLDQGYDEDRDEWNFVDKNDNLILHIDTYSDAYIPYIIYDVMRNLDLEDWEETIKKYFSLNFGLIVRDVGTSVSLGGR